MGGRQDRFEAGNDISGIGNIMGTILASMGIVPGPERPKWGR
jgi:hypothetical protein